MTSNQKLLALLLGTISSVLIVVQFAMGQILTSSADSEMRLGVLKAHKHSGHLMVVVCLVYIGLTMWWIVNLPTRRRGPTNPAE
ncbi:MAG: hypothetical protein KatS3mg108_1943 [Isosphaeraceae bacterium]|nr:MAG: hypothetical protein KatS3mg108_1943 [Isosphaeraceae bacterium]